MNKHAIRAGVDGVAESVDWTMTSRRSVRRFLPRLVPQALLEDLLRVASRAPSGVNAQPWKVHVLLGEALEGFGAVLSARYADAASGPDPDPVIPIYPEAWVEPYKDRRKKLGLDLYALLGIARGENDRMHAQTGRNFRFFDAPVGLIFTTERAMARCALLDCGMFMQNVMLAARARGLDTCPQAAFLHYHRTIADHLGLPDNEVVISGMSLGYADEDAVENALRTDRAALSDFACFRR